MRTLGCVGSLLPICHKIQFEAPLTHGRKNLLCGAMEMARNVDEAAAHTMWSALLCLEEAIPRATRQLFQL